MTQVLVLVAVAFTAWTSLLVALLAVEVLAGLTRDKRSDGASSNRHAPAYVILIPAHDEGGLIGRTVAEARKQASPAARVLVVADNCSDTTAAEARTAGAEVVERTDAGRRGKGFALAFGVEHLRSAPPAVVVILDADCTAAPGSLDLLAMRAEAAGRPMQALNLMLAAPGASLRTRMAAFAWAVHNDLRPRGLRRLGLPCHLMGTGMALPWECMDAVSIESDHVAEDLQLGLRLARAGLAAQFCPDARVESWFPADAGGLDTQRRRWEHGHLSMIVSTVPRTLWSGIVSRRGEAVALALDLLVPPLALLAMLIAASAAVGAWMSSRDILVGWSAIPLVVTPCVFAATILLAWWRAGRQWVSLAELLTVPWYMLRKLPLYALFLVRRQKAWVRTSRQARP
jgi:cellulose synthase/poly-beta-1,6-N-acetylglucosamine synthase-like glycosyltransferase